MIWVGVMNYKSISVTLGIATTVLIGSNSAKAALVTLGTPTEPYQFTASSCSAANGATCGPPITATFYGTFETLQPNIAGGANIVFTVQSGGASTADGTDPSTLNILPGGTYTFTSWTSPTANSFYFYAPTVGGTSGNDINSFGFEYSGTTSNLGTLTNGRFCYAGANNTPTASQCGNSAAGIPSVAYFGIGGSINRVSAPFTAIAVAPIIGLIGLRKRYKF